MSATEIGRLLALADEVLSFEGPGEELLERLERYSQTFAALYGDGSAIGESAGTAEARQELELLAGKHEKILEKAAGLRGLAGQSLRDLKIRAKGLRVYAGYPPGTRTSYRRTRKG